MSGPENLSKVDRLRARDGDNCWLCGGKLDFAAIPNSKKAPTLEHLDARANGGTDSLENLVLCHPGCNNHLGNRLKADKIKIRERWIKERGKRLAIASKTKSTSTVLNAQPSVLGPGSPKLTMALELTSTPKHALAPNATVTRESPPIPACQTDADRWRMTATTAIAIATFFAGLSLGLLLAA